MAYILHVFIEFVENITGVNILFISFQNEVKLKNADMRNKKFSKLCNRSIPKNFSN